MESALEKSSNHARVINGSSVGPVICLKTKSLVYYFTSILNCYLAAQRKILGVISHRIYVGIFEPYV